MREFLATLPKTGFGVISTRRLSALKNQTYTTRWDTIYGIAEDANMLKFLVQLFRSQSASSYPVQEQWQTSENGNPTTIFGSERVTLFPQDGGWRFVVASHAVEDDDPEYSDLYATQQQAKEAALAFVRREVSPHPTVTETRRTQRMSDQQTKWEGYLVGLEAAIEEANETLQDPKVNITKLRKPQRRIASGIKALGWQIPQYSAEGASDVRLQKALSIEQELRTLELKLNERISALQAARASKKAK